MKTLFASGLQNPRNTFWMGQQTAFVATTPDSTSTKEASITDVISQIFESGADVYGSYGGIQEAEAAAEGREAEARAREAAARTAQIMQQTQLLQQQGMTTKQWTPVLLVGAGLIALLGTAYFLTKK